MKIIKQSLFALISLCFFVSTVSALGVGSYQVNSYLNEPLEVEVPLTDTAGISANDLKVTLAHEFYFQLSKVQQKPIHNALNFDVRNKDGELYLYITSRHPVTDSFLKFITQFNWSNGRLLKEFTILLDPPKFSDPIMADSITPSQTVPSASGAVIGVDPVGLSQQEVVILPPAPAVPAPAPVIIEQPAAVPESIILHESEPYVLEAPVYEKPDLSIPPSMRGGVTFSPPSFATPPPAPSVPASVPSTIPASMQGYYKEPESYGIDNYSVSKGDTLWEISQRVAPSMNPQKTSMAILDSNPNAFINGNIHKLRADVELKIPSIDEIRNISLARARKAFEVQENPIIDDNETQLIAIDDQPSIIDDIETGLGEVQIATGTDIKSEQTAQTSASTEALAGVLKEEELVRINSENESIAEKVVQYKKAIEEGNELITAQNANIAELEKQLEEAKIAKAKRKGFFGYLLENLHLLAAVLLLPLLIILALLYFINKKRKEKVKANVLQFEELEAEMSDEVDLSQRFDVLHEVENLLAIDDKEAAIEILEAQLMANPEREDYRFKLAQIHWSNKNAENFKKVAAPLSESSDMAMRNRIAMLATQLGITAFATADAETISDETSTETPLDDDLAGFDFGDDEIETAEAEEITNISEELNEVIETPTTEEIAQANLDESENIDFDLDFDDIEIDTSELNAEQDIVDNNQELSFDIDDEDEKTEESDPLLSSANDNDAVDVQVKLDLAEAYIDMGDKEGALEILNEIIGLGGHDEQQRIRHLIEKC